MLTFPYGLRRDYTETSPVSALDLVRRARIVTAQIPGSLRGGGGGAGVFPLLVAAPDDDENEDAESPPPTDDEKLTLWLTNFVAAAQNAFKVTVSGEEFIAASGGAYIDRGYEDGGPLIYTQTPDELSVSRTLPDEDGTLYIHLALQLPDDPQGVAVIDSEMGDPSKLLVLDNRREPGALLLASVNSAGELTDERRFITPVLLAMEMAALRARLAELDAPVGGGEGGITTAQFLALQQRVTATEAAIADLQTQIDALRAALGTDAPLATRLSGRVERLREAHSGLLCDVVPLSPRAAVHQEAGVVVPGLAGMGEVFADGTTGKTSYVGGNLLVDIPNRRLI